ncbi:MAG TPA: hypothetical protein VFS54_05610 [Solirubrobacterales bacterium]|nr:hypothetical protein [Solirubrobacterales bacterium]
MDLRERFRESFATKAAKVKTGIPSTTNWHGTRNLIAEQVGVEPEDVYVTTISKPENVSVRFFQSKAVFRASLLIAMHTDAPATVPGTVRALREIAVEREVSAAVATIEDGKWSVVEILSQPGDEAAEELARCYPEATVVSI